MKQHFIGNVYRFEKQPDQMDLFVDIPLFNQDNAPLEILVSLEEKELEGKSKERLKEFNDLPVDLQEVVKKNSNINIEGQIKIVEEIENNLDSWQQLLNWKSYPDYPHLKCVIELCWKYLLKSGENKADVKSAAQLSVLTKQYADLQSIPAMIRHMANDAFG